jgi:mono/diheme cytochrome c family protein
MRNDGGAHARPGRRAAAWAAAVRALVAVPMLAAVPVLAAAFAWILAASSGPAAADEATAGAGVFAARCAVCHGPDAAGIPGSFPALREQVTAFASTAEGRDYLVMVVTTGLMGELKVAGVTYRGVMPAQSGLSEADIAAVLSHLASGRGKIPGPPAVTAADVTAARERHPERTGQATRALRPAYPAP